MLSMQLPLDEEGWGWVYRWGSLSKRGIKMAMPTTATENEANKWAAGKADGLRRKPVDTMKARPREIRARRGKTRLSTSPPKWNGIWVKAKAHRTNATNRTRIQHPVSRNRTNFIIVINGPCQNIIVKAGPSRHCLFLPPASKS